MQIYIKILLETTLIELNLVVQHFSFECPFHRHKRNTIFNCTLICVCKTFPLNFLLFRGSNICISENTVLFILSIHIVYKPRDFNVYEC